MAQLVGASSQALKDYDAECAVAPLVSGRGKGWLIRLKNLVF